MAIRIAIGAILGALVGEFIGYFARCGIETTCSLLGTPYVGCVIGAALGALVVFSLEPGTIRGSLLAGLKPVESAADFEELALKADRPVVAVFYRMTCSACRSMDPILDSLVADCGEKASFIKVNVDELTDVAQRLGVSTVPTMLVFARGSEVKRIAGAVPKSEIVAAVGAACKA